MTSPAFRDTRWSLVARATGADAPTARKALGELREAYWFPLYAYARRQGLADADAQDRVQGFCAELLGSTDQPSAGLAGADRARGRFRHYLLGAFRHHLAHERRAAAADKRGGGVHTWAFGDAAARYADELQAPDDTPERGFERRWARALLDRAVARLRAEHEAPAKADLLAALAPALLGEPDPPATAAIAARLGATDGAVRVALHRLRGRLRDLIRDEVRQTLADPDDVEDELLALRAALGTGIGAPDR